jgi:hypothetical protein
MSKRGNSPTESTFPLVNVQRYQSLKCDVNTRQLDELARYIAYVEEVNGDKPTEGEVVGAALVELFKLDRGFQKWKDRSQKTGEESPSIRESGPRHAPQV